ncbi:hypothetical protein TWF696_004958 [Orbilia brochopaga]|uniref:Solute carrier family 40 member n=1 Tax=Orbilia brochopaga TaxID=3140254 RepID=A0AAV9UZL4_9PEZI
MAAGGEAQAAGANPRLPEGVDDSQSSTRDTNTPSRRDVVAITESNERWESLDLRRPQNSSSSLRWLYLSHFLSTWNTRTYQFAAVIFTVEAFPNTLLSASISGIAQCIFAIILSQSVGTWVDRTPSRLKALRTTILVQRLAVLAACTFWAILLWSNDSGARESLAAKWTILSVIVVLSGIERLAAGGNTAVMERDWVPTLASAAGESSLHKLNAIMRRIDLTCKVLAPGFVTLLPISFNAIQTTAPHSMFWSVVVIASISFLSPWVEWVSAQRVWSQSELLQAPKIIEPDSSQDETSIATRMRRKFSGLVSFCHSAVFLPTISISLLYLSVLTFSSPMITFLLNSGFSLPVVTIARLFSSTLEVSATAIMPWGVKTLKNRPVKQWRHEYELEEQVGFLDESEERFSRNPMNVDKGEVERVGLWAVWWMTLTLLPAVYGVSGLIATPNTPSSKLIGLPNPSFSLPLLLGVALSRIGLWTYDLVYSQLQQTLPPPELRGEFTGIEQSFVSVCELLQWTLTAFMSRPQDFKTLAGVSWVAVLGAAGCYAWFIRQRRGHLLHVTVSSCFPK